MSKNLTRKGLALSAVVALGTSLFAGAPAQAAAELNIAPTAGTSYTVLGSDTFSVKAFGNADFSVVTATALRWKITKPSLSATVAVSDNATSSVTRTADGSDAKIEYVTPGTGSMTSTLGGNTLTLNPTTDAASDVVYKVQAYVESDGTVGLGSTELKSAEQTITFSGTAVPTLVLDQVGVGQQATGTVTYSPAINYDQTALANTKVVYTQNGTDRAITSSANRGSDSPATGLGVTSAGVTSWSSVAAGDVVAAVAKVVRYDGDTTYGVSASVTSSTNAATATAVSNTVTKGANITAGSTTTAYVVRKGTTSISYVAQFKKGTTAVAAGQPVAVTVSELQSSLADPDVVKVNGKTVSNTSGLSFNTVTGTDGKVTITVDNTYASAGDEIRIQLASGSATSDLSFAWAAATLAGLKEVSAPLANDVAAYTRTIVRGGTLTTSYALVDSFGQKWTSANTATTYRLSVYRKSGDTGTATWATLQPTFTDGVANLTITDNSTDNTGYRVSVDVEGRQGGDGAWGSAAVPTSLDLRIKPITSASAAAKITLGEALQNGSLVSDADGAATNSAARTTATLARQDRRVDDKSVSSLAILAAHSTKVTGVVKRSDNAVVPGASVTLSATGGVYFSGDAAGANVVSADSITVVADEIGVYTAYVFSATGGTKTITVTSGAATATQKIKFAAAAANSGTAIKITAPDYSSAGRTVDVSVLLTDEFGAPVQSTSASPLRVSVTGAGSNTTIAADSDADGLVSFKLIFGANETGSAVVKATYDAANDGTVDLTVTKTIVIGSAPAAAATAAVAGSTGKFFVSATAAAGKSVVVKVAGKFVTSFKATGSKKSVAVKATKGSKKVTVFVGGKLVATKTVTVK